MIICNSCVCCPFTYKSVFLKPSAKCVFFLCYWTWKINNFILILCDSWTPNAFTAICFKGDYEFIPDARSIIMPNANVIIFITFCLACKVWTVLLFWLNAFTSPKVTFPRYIVIKDRTIKEIIFNISTIMELLFIVIARVINTRTSVM